MTSGDQNIFLDRNRSEDRIPATQLRQFGSSPNATLSTLGTAVESYPGSQDAQSHPSVTSPLRGSRPHSGAVHAAAANRRDGPLLALPFQGEVTPRGKQTLRTSVDSPDMDTTASRRSTNDEVVPLEEKLCLEDLRRLMNFFATSYVTPPSQAQSTSRSRIRRTPRSEVFNRQRARLSFRSASSAPVPCEVERAGTPESGNQNVGTPLPEQELDQSGYGGSAHSILSRDGSGYLVETKEKPQVLIESTTSFGMDPSENYTRVLSESEFTDAVKFVVPWATETEIVDLMKKVDYEAKGTTTWDDFSTFLLSQGRHRSNMDTGTNIELITSPEPADTVLAQQHVTGSCMDYDGKRTLLLTGGVEGTVRAWNMEKLDSDGVVFAGDSWVVGVHWANQSQTIIIVTMNRKIIVLDAKTFTVTRLYRGRAVIDSAEGHMYSHESAPTVRIGGKVKPEGRRRGLTGAGTIMREKLKNAGSSSKTPPPPLKRVHQLALLRTGPYVECTLEECTLANLVDSVSCSLFQRSALGEDVVLLGTCTGEVRLYALPKIQTRVLVPNAVLRPHERCINKMSIMLETNALLTASDDGTVKMISLDNGALLHNFSTSGSEQHSAVHDFAINPQLRLLVTVGPERYGIVWDFSHDAPMAVLDAHNSPCRCCTMYMVQSQILTCATDGSIFVFDAHSFRLVQVLHTNLRPQCMSYDETGNRLVCLAARPYFHGQRRSAASACLHKYQGHLAIMVGVMYNKTHDLIVTIDVEGLVMTWRRSSGAAVFTFHLKDFSGSAVTNAARLTCFALDGLERRLLTGFNDGTVAVWNLVNGQTTNVITASSEGFKITPSNPGVTALGSLTRDGLTFLLFASAGHLFTTRESSTFTITSATKWPLPEEYGEITALLPVSPQIVVCGSSSGALVFYHILAERQEGSALWIIDTTADITPPLPQQQARRNVAPSNAGCPSSVIGIGPLADGRSDHPAVLTSRVLGVFPVHGAGDHVLMVVHSDGTVALWHTIRRLLMETVNLRGVLPTNTEGGLMHVAVDRNHRYFAFSDDAGNVHVCRIELRSVLDEGSLCPPRLLPIRRLGGRPITQWPGSPFDIEKVAPQKSNASGEEISVIKPLNEVPTDMEARIDPERVPFVFSVFSREYVFHTDMPSVSGLCIVDGMDEVNIYDSTNTDNISAPVTPSLGLPSPTTFALPVSFKHSESNEQAQQGQGSEEDRSQTSKKRSKSEMWLAAPPISGSALIIVSSGGDNFTRTFTLDGTIVGECGMNTWTLGQPSTYEYLGKKALRRLTPHYCTTDPVDFLQGAATEKPLSLIPRRSRVSRVAIRDGGGGAGNSTTASVGGPTMGKMSVNVSPIANGGLHSVSGAAPGEQTTSSMAEAAEAMGGFSRSSHPETMEAVFARHLNVSRMGGISPRKNAENVVLSTQMRARRRSRDVLNGIVKTEFISGLRGIPVLANDDEATPLGKIVSSDSVSNAQSSVKVSGGGSGNPEAPSENSQPPSIVTNSNNGSVRMASIHNNVRFSTCSCEAPTESRSSAKPPVLVHSDSKGRLTRAQAAATPVSHPPSEQEPPAPAPRGPPPAAAGLSRGDAPAEEEGPSRALVSGHMEAQRRMLLRLGRTDSVLGGWLDLHDSPVGSRPAEEQEDKEKGNLSTQLPATGKAKRQKNTVAQITSRLRIFHVDEMMPPKGTQAHEHMISWSDRVKHVKK